MSTDSYDFNLHGIVGVRLLDATAEDLAAVSRQLGPLRGQLSGPPDITVRFVERVTTSPITYVGLGDAGYNDEGFFVLAGGSRRPARAKVPFSQIGARPEIVCERNMPAVPHLLAIINLTTAAKGVLALHASAFTLGGLGVLVTGWAKSGKTESLLAAMDLGASYVGDEWVYLSEDGRMYGLPEPIRLWGWHLDQQRELLAGRSVRERGRLASWRALAGIATSAPASRVPGARLLARTAPLMHRQAYLQIPPAEMFGAERMALTGRLDAAVLVMSHEGRHIVSRPAGRTEISGRMAASLADERSRFMAHYRQFRYAFPDLAARGVELAGAREARLLSAIFDRRPAAAVVHPYPCDIAALGRAVVDAAEDVRSHGSSAHQGAAS